MSKIAETIENVDYLTALKELTGKIKEALKDENEVFSLRMGDSIKHDLVFTLGKEPIHRLTWFVKEN